MEKPHRFTMVHRTTKEEKPFSSYYTYPRSSDVSDWLEFAPGQYRMEQVWDVYEDMRFKAKMRLWEYITYFKTRRVKRRYSPYKNTEIGRSIPILQM